MRAQIRAEKCLDLDIAACIQLGLAHHVGFHVAADYVNRNRCAKSHAAGTDTACDSQEINPFFGIQVYLPRLSGYFSTRTDIYNRAGTAGIAGSQQGIRQVVVDVFIINLVLAILCI